jgi:hypothetical protein
MTDDSKKTPPFGFDVDRILAFNRDWARDKLLADGEIAVMWVIHTREGGILPVVFPDADVIPKPLLAHILGLICAAHDAWAIAMMSEAWMTSVRRGQWDGTAPSESENRVEIAVVTLGGTDPDGEAIRRVAISTIARDGAGKITGVEPCREGSGEVVDSWLFDVSTGPFDPPTRELARATLAEKGISAMPPPTIQ